MAQPIPPQQGPQVQLRYPQDKTVGDYSNGLAVGTTAHEITLDFLVNVNPPNSPPIVELVRRVRIPIAMAGSLLSGIGHAMDAYEARFGPIHVPQAQEPPTPPTG